jgi:ADP-dependent NAD(P)H-hydrate dehydratase / NAD(P)H-hydrate epimerase
MRVIYSDEMRILDHKMIIENKIPGLILMENAAEGLYKACIEYGGRDAKFVIFCGNGNNGGDGFALARKLFCDGVHVKVVLIGSKNDLKGDAKINAGFFIKRKLLNYIETIIDIDITLKDISKEDIIVDAIFGIGLSRKVSGIYKDTIDRMNGSKAKIISVDIPSGIDSDTGQILGTAVNADFTLTFQYPKPGHFLYPGRDYKGRLRVKKIGIDDYLDFVGDIKINAYSRNVKELSLKKRDPNTHKGTYGNLAIICASKGMSGAGVIATKSALKGGVGLLTLGVPECTIDIFQKTTVEAIAVPMHSDNIGFDEESVYALDDLMLGKDALAIGPGLSTRDVVIPLVEKALCEYNIPKVFDADALNLISKKNEILNNKVGDVVFTPHPKEFSKLTNLEIQEILLDPIGHAVNYAKKHSLTLLLKGSTTIVANQFGKVSLILTGTPGMAKGGSGDVLTGLIGSIMAQGNNAYDSAVLGAYIAGLAGELAEANHGEYSMTPLDTVENISKAIAVMNQ